MSAPLVTFASLKESKAADWALLQAHSADIFLGLPDRLLRALQDNSVVEHMPVSRLDHSLQSATRALTDGRSDEYVAACLLHDIGDQLAPRSHASVAAAIFRPYVSEEISWIIEHHTAFQFIYYGQHIGVDPNVRERYRGHPFFDSTAEFCELYDQNCFDASFESLPLEEFVPVVHRVFTSNDSSQSVPADG